MPRAVKSAYVWNLQFYNIRSLPLRLRIAPTQEQNKFNGFDKKWPVFCILYRKKRINSNVMGISAISGSWKIIFCLLHYNFCSSICFLFYFSLSENIFLCKHKLWNRSNVGHSIPHYSFRIGIILSMCRHLASAGIGLSQPRLEKILKKIFETWKKN